MTVTIRYKHHGKHRPKDRTLKDVKAVNNAYVNNTPYVCLFFNTQQICIPASEIYTIQTARE